VESFCRRFHIPRRPALTWWRTPLSAPHPLPLDDTDASLLARWRQGDEQAFASLFERYRGRAMGYALRMLRRRELAEEVCTDTWCAVLEGRYRPTGAFRGFLFTVLHRHCLQLLRRQQTRRRLSFKLFRRPEPPRAEAELAEADEHARLHRALDSLPDEQRSVLLLYYAQELPSREVAQILGCTDQQVRSRLSYARRKLRLSLESAP